MKRGIASGHPRSADLTRPERARLKAFIADRYLWETGGLGLVRNQANAFGENRVAAATFRFILPVG